jgi:hypothetical protein
MTGTIIIKLTEGDSVQIIATKTEYEWYCNMLKQSNGIKIDNDGIEMFIPYTSIKLIKFVRGVK